MPSTPQRSGKTNEPFAVRFSAHVHEVPDSRRGFVAWMRTNGFDADVVDDLEVVFSELAANAVAASPAQSDEVRARAHYEDGTLLLEVSNRAEDTGRASLPTPDLDDPLRPNGRGLLIARAFVDTVEIDVEEPDRIVVRCCRTLSPTA